jgi:RNA polymerase sigma-70 factor (ECF subfamily)
VKSAPTGEVTGLLRAWSRGDAHAAEKLVPLVYEELRRLAARHLRRERRDHTLRPTALVHEVYLRLIGKNGTPGRSRAQFFALAARVMRNVLVDHARHRRAGKRGGGWRRITLEEGVAALEERNVDLVALEDALNELTLLDAQKARMVELRFFGGLTLEDTADTLGVSTATVTREWRMARAWLYRRIQRGAGQGPNTASGG